MGTRLWLVRLRMMAPPMDEMISAANRWARWGA